MKTTKRCPKCESRDILRFDGYVGPYGSGNNLQTGKTIFSSVPVNRYICARCGYTEEWIEKEDLERVIAGKKAKRE